MRQVPWDHKALERLSLCRSEGVRCIMKHRRSYEAVNQAHAALCHAHHVINMCARSPLP